nr:fimbrillin family protein [Prevotella sp.]
MKTMKIMKRLMGCAAAILALTACSESEDLLAAYHSDSKAVHITAQVGKASADGFTRSNPLGTAEEQAKFNENDEISVKADGQDAVTYKLVDKEWQPQGGKFLKWENETMNFTAYYPATFNGTINQPTEYNKEADLAAADFMSFSGPQKNDNNNQLTLTMERKMARVVVEIAGFNDQYAGAKIDNVNSLSICGIKAYKHSDNKFYALIKPCEAQNSETFISLDVAEGESKTTETLTGIPALEAGNSYTYKLTVGKNKISVSGITVTDWDNTGIITEGSKAEHIIPYVTFKANGKQTFQMTAVPDYEISGLEYSVNNDEKWRKVEKDGKISFGGEYGDLRLRGTNHNGTAKDESYYSTIKFTDETVNVACTGDIRTLLDWKNYNIVKTDNARFCSLFETCSVLTSAPELPATKLANCCYYYMFYKCTNLTSAPVLPATILAQECYSNMFTECTNLTSAPELPATKLAVHCYYSMFSNCPKLSSVTMLAPKSEIETKNNCVLNWLDEAGNDASVTTRTLKVQDEAAYKALENKTAYLPDIWKKGATGTTVVDENNAEINIE